MLLDAWVAVVQYGDAMIILQGTFETKLRLQLGNFWPSWTRARGYISLQKGFSLPN